MTNIELFDTLTNENSVLFQSLRGSILKTSVAVFNEDPKTENHDARLAWARQATTIPVPQALTLMARKMIFDVLTNPTIQSKKESVLDDDVDFQVSVILSTPSILSRY